MQDVLDILTEIKPEFDFSDSSDFIADGMLDSFDIINLCDLLEEKYNVTIDGLDILPENFTSLNSIQSLIIKSKGESK
ncbi:MAG: acyl carrier protein [Lachnospiraceae bacterium]|nr:acyl carrier protein [Lachnospiraceae bacterium]